MGLDKLGEGFTVTVAIVKVSKQPTELVIVAFGLKIKFPEVEFV